MKKIFLDVFVVELIISSLFLMIVFFPAIDPLKRFSKLLVVYMGSFSPFHVSHAKLVSDVLEIIPKAKCIIAPVNDLYPKNGLIKGFNKNGLNHRIEMCRLTVDNITKNAPYDISVCDHAFSLNKPLVDGDMMRYFAETYPDYQIAYLMGRDVYDGLNTWDEENRKAITDPNVNIIVHDRSDNVSSSLIRETYRKTGALVDVCEDVKNYILENKINI